MKFGVIASLLLIGVAFAFLAGYGSKIETDRYSAFMIETLNEGKVEMIAGDGESDTVLGYSPTEEQLAALQDTTDGWGFLTGGFNYVNVFIGTLGAAGAAYIIKARLQGSASA